MNLRTCAPFVVALASSANAASVYLMSSGDSFTDSAASLALTSRGHTVTIGLAHYEFDGSANLAGFDTVYLQCNYSWTAGAMPLAGQQQLIDWVSSGGRLVTSEWTTYYTYAGGWFDTLATIMPAEHSFTYDFQFFTAYSQVTPDAEINAGLPPVFDFPLTSFAGTETHTVAKPGATTYYTTSTSIDAAGLVGWSWGAGRVYSFLSTCGADQVSDPEFGQLFSNVMGSGSGCYPDCENDGDLDIFDYLCFLNEFAASSPYADCENDGDWDVFDFLCFQGQFANGCD